VKYPKAFKVWWNGICLKGDPMHRPNLTGESFDAGYEAGARAILIALGEHAKAGNKWAVPLEDRADV
jgi:hypothetical protein